MRTAIPVATTESNRYVPRGRNELHTIFQRHFCAQYDEKYAATYGRYSLERIQQIVALHLYPLIENRKLPQDHPFSDRMRTTYPPW